MLFALSLALLFVVSIAEEQAKKKCSATAPDGTYYDLASLDSFPDCTQSDGEWKYQVDVCEMGVACPAGAPCAYCQVNVNDPALVFCLGTKLEFTGLDAGVGLSVQSLMGVGDRSGLIEFKCDQSGSNSAPTCSSTQQKNGYKYTLNTAAACPTSPKGLSGGSVFLILLFVFAAVYLIGGVAYNKFQRHESGLELIPNIEFWREFPGLVQDGVVFVVHKVRGI